VAPGVTSGSGGFVAAWRRELHHLRHDAWDLGCITWLPFVMLAAMAWLFTNSVMRDVPVAFVDLDHSPESRMLARMVDHALGVAVTEQWADRAQAMASLRRLEVFAVVLVPRDMSREAMRGGESKVVVFYNAAYLTTGQVVLREISGAVGAFNSRLLVEQIGAQVGPSRLRGAPLAVQANILYNPQASFELFLLPLIFPSLLSLVAALAAATALGRELRDGTVDEWLGTRPWGSIAGKLAPYVVVFSVYGVLSLVYLARIRGIGVAGSVLVLVLAQPLLYMTSCSVPLMVAGLSRDMTRTLSFVALFIGTALPFTGATFPVTDAPLFTRIWNLLLPLTAYIKLQTQQLIIGSPWAVSLWPIGTLCLIVLVTGGIGAMRLAAGTRDEGQAATA